MGPREQILSRVAELLCRHPSGHPLRVGVDGVCGVGKSTFAHDLVAHVRAAGRPARHLDSDGFHHVAARRRRNRTDPARGYYEDADDLAALRELVLEPLGLPGPARYAAKIHDLGSDAVVREWAVAPADAVVVFAATFLQRDELRGCWDEVIWLDADETTAMTRAVARDADLLGGPDVARHAHDTRYLAACRIYLAEQRPRERASIVIGHDDPARPRLIQWPAQPVNSSSTESRTGRKPKRG